MVWCYPVLKFYFFMYTATSRQPRALCGEIRGAGFLKACSRSSDTRSRKIRGFDTLAPRTGARETAIPASEKELRQPCMTENWIPASLPFFKFAVCSPVWEYTATAGYGERAL